jgi:hypothetical protein
MTAAEKMRRYRERKFGNKPIVTKPPAAAPEADTAKSAAEFAAEFAAKSAAKSAEVDTLKARILELERKTAMLRQQLREPTPAHAKIKHEVKYCGTTIWPGRGLDHISYDDLKAGWHLADHWLKTIEVATPQKPNEVLTAVMHLLQDIKAASSINGLCDVMGACIGAYAKRNGRKEKADFIGGMPPGLPR